MVYTSGVGISVLLGWIYVGGSRAGIIAEQITYDKMSDEHQIKGL